MPAFSTMQNRQLSLLTSIQARIEKDVERIEKQLPDPDQMTPDHRRGIIARYTAVLEGNFIYWMTGASLAVRSEKSREILRHNLEEEVRDCHPGMLRRFAVAAGAYPSNSDALAISPELTNVRLLVGRLSPVPTVVMMAFFECFIQRFMAYLQNLATLQGSEEREYTDVHGICDIAHTAELMQAVAEELRLEDSHTEIDSFEGVNLLTALIQSVIALPVASVVAAA